MKDYKVMEILTGQSTRSVIEDTLNAQASIGWIFKSISFDEAFGKFILIFEKEKK
jgi:hypothetical protein